MADLDDFFKKKDKKKKKGGGFSKANTDVLAKNLEETARKEQLADEKAAAAASVSASTVASVVDPANKSNGHHERQDRTVSSTSNGQGQGQTTGQSEDASGAASGVSSSSKYFGVVNSNHMVSSVDRVRRWPKWEKYQAISQFLPYKTMDLTTNVTIVFKQ